MESEKKGMVKKNNLKEKGLRRVSVVQSKFKESSLIRPDDLFMPMGRYRKKYGSPSLPKNKKAGHRKARVDGVKGVVIPGDDGECAWRIRNTSGVRLMLDKDQCGSGYPTQGAKKHAGSGKPERHWSAAVESMPGSTLPDLGR